MSVTGSMRSSVRTVGAVVGMVLWCLATIWLGIAWLWRAGWFVLRFGQVFSRTLRCPRGHAVDAFAPLRCGRCHAAFEGHVFDSCPGCGAKARFIACPCCGLAVWNRLA